MRYELERDSLSDAEKHEKPALARPSLACDEKFSVAFRRPSLAKHGFFAPMASLDTLSSWRAAKTIQGVTPVHMVTDGIETRQIVAELAF